MKIHVTAEDIKNGVRSMCKACPIALAVARASSTDDLRVGVFTIRVGNGFWSTPKRAKEFISSFDAGKPVKPFTFLLTASPDYKMGTP